MKLDVRLVSHADVVREALLALEPGLGDHVERHVPALSEKSQITFWNLVEADKVEADVDVDHPAGVRTQYAHLVLRGDIDDLVLKLLALTAELAESGGDDDDAGNTLAPALVENRPRVSAGVVMRARSTGPSISRTLR